MNTLQAEWIRQAMRQALDAQASDVLPLPVVPAPRTTGARWLPWGAGRHSVVEIALALQEGVMSVEGHVCAFRPPSLAVLPPGVWHCEGYARAQKPYASLWLVGGGGSLFAMASRYRPRRGWDSPWRGVLRGPAARRLLLPLESRAAASAPWDAPGFERFRADLLAVLAELYRLAAVEPASRPTDGSAARPPALDALLEHVSAFMDENLSRPFTLSDVARLTRLTPRYINRLFRQRYGEPIHAALARRRMEKARALLKGTDLLAKEVAGRVGFQDPLYFSRCFHRHFGRAPSEVRKAGDR